MSTAEVFSACTAGKQIGLQISATRWHSCMACRIQQCLQGMEMGDICLCKHDNNMHKMFIFINDLYQFPVVLCCIFLSLSLFKDIFSAVPLSNLGLFQRDVFEVLCLCPVERVQEISGNFFFFLHEQPWMKSVSYNLVFCQLHKTFFSQFLVWTLHCFISTC